MCLKTASSRLPSRQMSMCIQCVAMWNAIRCVQVLSPEPTSGDGAVSASERDVVSINGWLIARPADRLHWVDHGELQEQSATECTQGPTVWDSVLGRADGRTVERTMPGQGPRRIGLEN